MDTGIEDRWMMRLEQYTIAIRHCDCNRHQNADELSQKIEFYEVCGARLEEQANVRTTFPFMSWKQLDNLPHQKDIDINGWAVPKPLDDVLDKLGSVELNKDMCSELRKKELNHHSNAKLRKGKQYTAKALQKAQETDSLRIAVLKLMHD